jgi:phosphatidylglycerol:prolipoprotein diacylglycerol transferase
VFPVLQLGPLAIQTAGLFLLLGLWIGLSLSDKYCREFSIQPQALDQFFMLDLLAGVIGARLVYVIRYPQAFISSPLSLFSINPGLFDLFGGLACALIFALIYLQRKAMDWYSVADALTPLGAVLAISIGFAHLADGNAYGAPAALPWAVFQWGAYRHPSQVYEILASLVVLAILLHGIWRKRYSFPGASFLNFVSLTAGTHLFLAGFRGDSQFFLAGFRTEQVVAWLVMALCLFVLSRRRNLKHEIEG